MANGFNAELVRSMTSPVINESATGYAPAGRQFGREWDCDKTKNFMTMMR